MAPEIIFPVLFVGLFLVILVLLLLCKHKSCRCCSIHAHPQSEMNGNQSDYVDVDSKSKTEGKSTTATEFILVHNLSSQAYEMKGNPCYDSTKLKCEVPTRESNHFETTQTTDVEVHIYETPDRVQV